MDGFAVRSRPSERVAGGSIAPRRVVGRTMLGGDHGRLPTVDTANAVEIPTGGALPAGADCVVRSEGCRRRGRTIYPLGPLVPGRDIARAGEDFRPGQVVVEVGTRLRPWHVAALTANETARVRVLRTFRVGVLSTGGEVTPRGNPLRRGGVRDTTKPLLLGMLAELGVEPVDLGVADDVPGAIRRAVLRGLGRSDALLTIGGSSIGVRDLVPQVIRSLPGARVVAARVRLRPGSATGVALVRGQPVFQLSGPPIAAMAGFLTLVEPFLRSRGTPRTDGRGSVPVRLDRELSHPKGLREVVRVRLRGGRRGPRASVIARHGAARLSSLTRADGYVVLHESRGDYHAGETVEVHRL